MQYADMHIFFQTHRYLSCHFYCYFFFTTTTTPEIYTLSLHDALPISAADQPQEIATLSLAGPVRTSALIQVPGITDRKSTRLNSSHGYISYAVFCLKKKKIQITIEITSHEIEI